MPLYENTSYSIRPEVIAGLEQGLPPASCLPRQIRGPVIAEIERGVADESIPRNWQARTTIAGGIEGSGAAKRAWFKTTIA